MLESKALPMDDIRHCPEWLRVTDRVNKKIVNVGAPKRKVIKTKTGRKQTGGRLFVQSTLAAFDESGTEQVRGTYKELSFLHDVSIGSLKNSRARKTRNRHTGFWYKLVEEKA